MAKKNLLAKIFGQQKFWSVKYFGLQKFLVRKDLLSRKTFSQQKFLVRNISGQQNFLVRKISGQRKKFVSKTFCIIFLSSWADKAALKILASYNISYRQIIGKVSCFSCSRSSCCCDNQKKVNSIQSQALARLEPTRPGVG